MKMKFGHHGANHPVQELATGRVLITSQNHGFAVDESSLPENLMPTHRSLFDGSLQGVARTDRAAFSFQGHPEASPGPHDLRPLFEAFIAGHAATAADAAAHVRDRRAQPGRRGLEREGRPSACHPCPNAPTSTAS